MHCTIQRGGMKEKVLLLLLLLLLMLLMMIFRVADMCRDIGVVLFKP